MSLANATHNQHDPMKKHVNGIVVWIIENTAIHSIHNAIKYPNGVFQLNGNLSTTIKGEIDRVYIKIINSIAWWINAIFYYTQTSEWGSLH